MVSGPVSVRTIKARFEADFFFGTPTLIARVAPLTHLAAFAWVKGEADGVQILLWVFDGHRTGPEPHVVCGAV